jgi:hypothetical protein
MKTTIYWALQHSYCIVHEFRFRTTCWWLSQQVEFLEWRLRLEATMPYARSGPAPASVGQGDQYAVRSV